VKKGEQLLDWILEKHFIELIILALAFAIIVLLLWALPYPPCQASGWWQVAIAIIGLPLVLHELYHLRKTLQEKPRIQLGLAPGEPTPPQITKGEILPAKTISLSRAKVSGDFSLVVENVGNVPAKSVRIQLRHEPAASDSSPASVRPKYPGTFRIEPGGILTSIDSDKLKLYPHTPQMFVLGIGHPSHTGLHQLLRDVAPGEHLLHCTVWAEGLKDESITVNEELAIRIVD